MSEISPLKIIIAEEIATPKGEIMGMFLSEEITSPCPVEEAIKRIKDQNGLVCVPHPADALRSSALGLKNLHKIIGDVDVIETFNARNYMPGGNAKADAVARRFNKLRSAGSDAHTPGEIGMAFVQMEDFVTQDDFRLCLRNAIIRGKISNPLVHLSSTGNKLVKRFSN
ncbi:MAG TPA: PHP domain-containing protein [Dehalococcoidia bacterium]|nr:PHP domain-containing protein [Dehalococcoidia bacterium]